MTIQFFCPGKPSAQGSKVYMGRGVMIDSDKNLKSWRSVVATACPITTPLTCGLAIEIEFRYNRPASHFGTRSKQRYLKGNAPIYKTSAPDCDKLIRAVGDALKGVAYVDDALIVKITASKLYTMGTAGALVTITPLSEP